MAFLNSLFKAYDFLFMARVACHAQLALSGRSSAKINLEN